MATSAILAKFGTPTAITITIASLASSTAGVGRQSTLVDNTTDRFQSVHLYVKIKTGGSQTANKGIYLYLLKADKTSSANSITDGAGTSDAGLTIKSAQQIAGAMCVATTAQTYQFDCVINNPGPCWGVAIVHDTNENLDSTGGNHCIYYVGENQEAQ